MHARTELWFAIGAAALAAACASRPGVATTSPVTTTTSSGDVALNDNTGMWLDSAGGTWMDNSGGMWRGGRRGMAMGLQAADIRSMSNGNIVAHLAAGDSLEIALSQLAASRAQNRRCATSRSGW